MQNREWNKMRCVCVCVRDSQRTFTNAVSFHPVGLVFKDKRRYNFFSLYYKHHYREERSLNNRRKLFP